MAAEDDAGRRVLDGAAGGGVTGSGDPARLILSETARPKVPMGLYVGVPYAAALGFCEALREEGLDAQLVWPHGVAVASDDGSALVSFDSHGGYDDDGMFCRVEAASDGTLDLGPYREAGLAGIRERLGRWEGDIAAGTGMAGPLAAFLSDYFDLVGLMGKKVELRYPNGRLLGKGTLAGMDIWGRATVTLDDGRQLEVSREQARIRPAGDAS